MFETGKGTLPAAKGSMSVGLYRLEGIEIDLHIELFFEGITMKPAPRKTVVHASRVVLPSVSMRNTALEKEGSFNWGTQLCTSVGFGGGILHVRGWVDLQCFI